MQEEVSFLLEDHRNDNNRSGEGSMVELANGDLLFVYGVFDGGNDASPARLVQRRSKDGGRTWSDRMSFMELPVGTCNIMSVSLQRLADGRLACVYIHKITESVDDILFIVSEDEGATWSKPLSVSGNDGLYYVVNNDRLAQLSSGRLLIPFALHLFAKDTFSGDGKCGCFLSDDGGRSWRHGKKAQGLEPASVPPPILGGGEDEQRFQKILATKAVLQEPGVIELLDGRVLMWARSNTGRAFAALSTDAGESWSEFKPFSDFAMPSGPQALYRLPNSKRIVMFYNDRAGIPFGDGEFEWRTPLSVAVSDDEAATWRRLPDIENNEHNYCYLSACFAKERVALSYYQGVEFAGANRKQGRRNLHSLRVRSMPLSRLLA